MTAAFEQITWVCRRTQVSAKLFANGSYKSQSGEFPYLRQVRQFRVTGMHALEVVPGDVIVDSYSRAMIVTLTDHRPGLPWSMLTAVYLQAVSVGQSSRGVICVVMRPVDRGGLDARREDVVEFHDVECVFARSAVTEQTQETLRTKFNQDVCYLDRYVANKLQTGWSIHDGTSRWRVDAVRDIEKLDRLPYAVVSQTGFT